MPVDSVHATIENHVKRQVVWGPSEWPTLIRNSRVKLTPYTVHILKHQDFLDWKTFQSRTFPSSLKQEDKTVVKLKALRRIVFKKDEPDVIFVSDTPSSNNLSMVSIKKEARKLIPNQFPARAYKTRIPIATEKYQSLKLLCNNNTIPAIYQNEYLSLPTKPTVPNCLLETDEEDEVSLSIIMN